ncbi:MAG: methyl-accepting chemotaxis protein, partial [Shewanella sp.]
TYVIDAKKDIDTGLKHIIIKAEKDSHVIARIDSSANELEQAISNAIRGLQFSDITSQNLIYTNESLSHLNESLNRVAKMSQQEFGIDGEDITTQMSHRRQEKHNPVSRNQITCGDIELF